MSTDDTTQRTTPRTRRRPSEAPDLTGYDGMSTDDTGNATVVPLRTGDDTAGPTTEPLRLDRWIARSRVGEATLTRPRPTWLIDGYLPANAWGALYAPPKVGKTHHALSLAVTAALGGTWAGRTVEPLRVLYVMAEKPALITERLEAWRRHLGTDLPDTYVDVDIRPQLGEPDQVADLVALVQHHRSQLVVIDTLAPCMLGREENSAKDMGPVCDALDHLAAATDGGTVHVVHHAGKDVTKGMRGSSAILGAAHYTWQLSRDGNYLKLVVDNLNAGKEPLPEWYRLQEMELDPLDLGGKARSSAVLLPADYRVAQDDSTAERLTVVMTALAAEYDLTGISPKETDDLLDVARGTTRRVLDSGVRLGWLDSNGKATTSLRFHLTDLGRAQLPD